MRDLSTYDNSAFDRGVPRWKEATWWMVRALLFDTWLPLPSRLKVGCLRLFGAKLGTDVVIRSRVNVTFPWRLTIGNHVWIGDEVFILSLDQVQIGSHVCISQRAFLCTGSHDHRKTTFNLITKPITIGDGCWIAAQAFIGPGVTMGEGSVCAAGAVVVKDVDAGSVVGGNPSGVIGY